jgi:hypothetical protein
MTRKSKHKEREKQLRFAEVEVGGRYSSRKVWSSGDSSGSLAISLPFGAAKYAEAVKLVRAEVPPSAAGKESHVRVPDCSPPSCFYFDSSGDWETALAALQVKRVCSVDGGPKTPENREWHPATQPNPYTVLDGVDMDGCSRSSCLRKKAVTLVKWYRRLGLPYERDLQPRVECGQLRQAVRQCFSQEGVTLLWELSFKSIQKIERDCCRECEPTFLKKLGPWYEARAQPVEVDPDHLERFRHAFAGNVDQGWDLFRTPFIPNGNATESFKRRDGGNWNREEFSETCRVELVFSSGKPRIVTMYSSANTALLAPLHYSLYSTLKRKGWLLVGEPTEKDISKLTGTRFLSFDYSSATDMIKTAYVQAAVDVLISKAHHLTDDEIRALRVLSTLSFDGGVGVTTRGQPMGSIMSFPLLCLMNKTVVDLSLTELLKRKEISFREWSSHPCLINGDDLLTKEVRSGTNLRGEVVKEGGKVGFIVNEEKTLDSKSDAEINSTLFSEGVAQRKLNVSSLWMKPDVNDVLGFAAEASIDGRTFVKIVRANAHILSKQDDKRLWALSPALQGLCRKDKKIRRAICCSPTSVRPVLEGVMRMAVKPEAYTLSREEEYNAVVAEVERVREMGIRRSSERLPKFRTSFVPNSRSFQAARKVTKSIDQELILKCLVDRFDLKLKEDLVLQELADLKLFEDPPFDGSRIDHMVDLIRAGRATPERNETFSTELAEFLCV